MSKPKLKYIDYNCVSIGVRRRIGTYLTKEDRANNKKLAIVFNRKYKDNSKAFLISPKTALRFKEGLELKLKSIPRDSEDISIYPTVETINNDLEIKLDFTMFDFKFMNRRENDFWHRYITYLTKGQALQLLEKLNRALSRTGVPEHKVIIPKSGAVWDYGKDYRRVFADEVGIDAEKMIEAAINRSDREVVSSEEFKSFDLAKKAI
ncbi:hypothetical protein [Fuchsiella alkaliacetigena]|uniref:hypothetical protein n=1 Tax=Fuchsiella alkaliacetigena TaxID=957042 RepID=UPI00200A4170|nr:hypothetical protein [Fuchsiella alkaliacetigena]MCK8824707.1 hypothetical protein [Fuchsiella alkaliacetigena]